MLELEEDLAGDLAGEVVGEGPVAKPFPRDGGRRLDQEGPLAAWGTADGSNSSSEMLSTGFPAKKK